METKSVLRKALFLPYQLYVILIFGSLTFFGAVGSYVASFFDANGNWAHRCLTYWARGNLALAGLRIQVEGLERLDPEKTYIFMPNHASFLDILLAFATIPYNFRFIIKEELFSIPFLGLALRSSGQLPMDRKNPRKGLRNLRQAGDPLREGISVVVFPEGTRTRQGAMQDFKATLFLLPIRTRVPVVPVLIEGSFQALKRGSILLNRVPLRLTFYDPIPADMLEDRDRGIYAEKVRRALSRSMPG
ncbi:MAG: lysophospholipid acyltransferase family protein [Candidatus Binatia bacterium]